MLTRQTWVYSRSVSFLAVVARHAYLSFSLLETDDVAAPESSDCERPKGAIRPPRQGHRGLCRKRENCSEQLVWERLPMETLQAGRLEDVGRPAKHSESWGKEESFS